MDFSSMTRGWGAGTGMKVVMETVTGGESTRDGDAYGDGRYFVGLIMVDLLTSVLRAPCAWCNLNHDLHFIQIIVYMWASFHSQIIWCWQTGCHRSNYFWFRSADREFDSRMPSQRRP